jgi:hypothetical protein
MITPSQSSNPAQGQSQTQTNFYQQRNNLMQQQPLDRKENFNPGLLGPEDYRGAAVKKERRP